MPDAHRFLSPAAAEAFAGVTPEQVRADLARFDSSTYDGVEPEWASRIRALDSSADHGPWVRECAFRFLLDQAATVDQPKPRPLCRCGHPEHDHLWPTCWGCNRRTEGPSVSCEAGEGDGFCDCEQFVPVEGGS
jgi:hypothetical protein